MSLKLNDIPWYDISSHVLTKILLNIPEVDPSGFNNRALSVSAYNGRV